MAERKEYVKLWLSYGAYFQPLSAAEVGRLTLAMIEYKSSGAEPEFSGNERFTWPAIKRDIDEATAAQADQAEQNRENGKKGGRPKKPNGFSENQVGFSESEKSHGQRTKGKGQRSGTESPPLPPSLGGCGPELNATFSDWLAYKSERRQGYKPIGLKALISRVEAAAQQHGERAVIDLIRECMASGYQGIIWDRLKGDAAAGGKPVSDRDRIRTAEDYAKGRSFFDD